MWITPLETLPELFSGSRYSALLAGAATLPLTGTRKEIRIRLRENCPQAPGVYGMVSPAGQLIYVGMSCNLQKRLQSYFSSKVSQTKERRIGHRSTTLIWQASAHDLIARLRERELIRLYRPNYNVQGHPTRMKLGYITLVDQPAAAFSLQSRLPRKHQGVWGPLPVTSFLRRAVGELNHHFQLRDCPRETLMVFRGEVASESGHPAKACIRADLKTCLAPCISACSKTQYSRMVAGAKKFLDGDSRKTLSQIAEEMRAAVAERKYERAAMLRDRMQALERIDLHLRRFHDWSSLANFVYPIHSYLDEAVWWLIVVRGTVVELVPQPRSREEKQAIFEHLTSLENQIETSRRKSEVTGPDDFESSRLLHRWFRHFPEKKSDQLTLAKAKRLCQSTQRSTQLPRASQSEN